MSKYKEEFSKSISHLQQELQSLRSGRATPAMVENLSVENYGVKTPLKQVATIHTPEPRLIVIEPWDKNNLKEIEKSVAASSLSATPSSDGQVVRVQLAAMTEESRQDTVKVLHQKLEEAEISVRQKREEILKEYKRKKDKGEISEDDFFKEQKILQESVDEANAEIKNIGEAKEKEINTI